MSNFVSLQTSLTGIRAAQVGLDTASHNVANANTAGYTRQRVELAARAPYASPVGPLGTGVDVTEISRGRDVFLDRRARLADAGHGEASVRADLLSRAESLLGEPDYGISGELDGLWDAFEDLALSPSDGAARRQVVAALGSLTARVRSVANGWQDLRDDTVARADAAVDEVNTLLQRVASLNASIPAASMRGTIPNDLLDERDLALDRLAQLTGATSTQQADGSVTVSLGAQVLVQRQHTGTVTRTAGSPLALDFSAAPPLSNAAALAPDGELGGISAFLSDDLAQANAGLDAFAGQLASALNDLHATGVDADGLAGGPLLVFDPGAGASAAQLHVAAPVAADPRRLAAAAGPPTNPATPPAALDARIAEQLAALRTAPAGTPSVSDQYRAQVVELAGNVAAADRAASEQDALRVTARSMRSAAHGVSLDEEMVSLVQYQRHLEAASRVMTTVDEALDVLINRTGVVGR